MIQAGLSGLLLVETGLTGLIAGLLAVPVRVGIAATLVYVLDRAVSALAWNRHVDPMTVAQGVALAVGAALLPGSTPPAGPPGARRPRSCAMTERRLARSSTRRACRWPAFGGASMACAPGYGAGMLVVATGGGLIWGVNSSISPEYRMNLNGLNSWYFSISLR